MKKYLSLLTLMAGLGMAQTTNNLHLAIPPTGTPNWGPLVNQNMVTIDALLAGFQNPHTRPGDITYWTGSIYATLPGNNSGNNCLSEDSAGTPSWAGCGGGGGGGIGGPGSSTVGHLATWANTTGTLLADSLPVTLVAGTNVTITGGPTYTISASSTAATAWASLTAGTNTNAGTYAFGASTTFDLTNSADFKITQSASATTSAGQIRYNTSVGQYEVFLSGARKEIPTIAFGGATASQCAYWISAYLLGSQACGAGGGGFYQTFLNNTTPVTQRNQIALVGSGGGNHAVQFTFTDSSSPSQTTVTADVLTGPGGGLDCVTNPYCLIDPAIIGYLANAQTWTGKQTFGITQQTTAVSATEATIASAATIAPSSPVTIVSGTAAIDTMTAQTGCTTSGIDCYQTLVATGAWSLTTAGNFAAILTAAANQAYSFVYRPSTSKWVLVGAPASAGGGQSFTTTDQGDWLNGVPTTVGSQVSTALHPNFFGITNYATSRKVSAMVLLLSATIASSNCKVSIMDSTGSLLASSNSAATSGSLGSAIPFVFASPYTMTSGYYYIGVVCDSDGVGFYTVDSTNSLSLKGKAENSGATLQYFYGTTLGSFAFGSTVGTRGDLAAFGDYEPAFYARP